MMRYFEWLFPIMKYVRLRREVSGWRCLAAFAIALLIPAGITAGVLFYGFSRSYGRPWAGRPGWYVVPTNGTNWAQTANAFLSAHLDSLIVCVIVTAVALGLLMLGELTVALNFVRKRPGRRRPLCTWQTIKSVSYTHLTLPTN